MRRRRASPCLSLSKPFILELFGRSSRQDAQHNNLWSPIPKAFVLKSLSIRSLDKKMEAGRCRPPFDEKRLESVYWPTTLELSVLFAVLPKTMLLVRPTTVPAELMMPEPL